MKSNFKNLINVDYSGNNIFNISRIIGNEYPTEKFDKVGILGRLDDLLITTAGKLENDNINRKAGNLLLRAGVVTNNNNTDSGYVHLFAGASTEPTSNATSTVRGILLNPDSTIYISSDLQSVVTKAAQDIIMSGLSQVVLSTEDITSSAATHASPITNYIKLVNTFSDSEILGRTGNAIVAVTPNLDVHYTEHFRLKGQEDTKTTFDADVDNVEIDTSYVTSGNNNVIDDLSAFNLSITGNNTSSVRIHDILSYGTVTAQDVKVSGDFTFKDLYNKGTEGSVIKRGEDFTAYGKDVLFDFYNIRERYNVDSSDPVEFEIAKESIEKESLGNIVNPHETFNLTSLGNGSTRGKSTLTIQYVDILENLRVSGKAITLGTLGKEETKEPTKQITVTTQNYDLDSSGIATETYNDYLLCAGLTGSESPLAKYALEIRSNKKSEKDATTSEIILDDLQSRRSIKADGTVEIDGVSTIHNEIILKRTKATIANDTRDFGTTDATDVKDLNIIKTEATSGILDKLEIISHDINLYRTGEKSSRYIEISKDKIHSKSDWYETDSNKIIIRNTQDRKINENQKQINNLFDLKSDDFIIQNNSDQPHFKLEVKTKNPNTVSETEDYSKLDIKNIDSSVKIDANEISMDGDFTFNNTTKDFDLDGNQYTSNFNFFDIYPINDKNITRFIAYNETYANLDTYKAPELVAQPSGMSPISKKPYSQLLVQNTQVDKYAYIQGVIDIHKEGDNRKVIGTPKIEAYTNLLNILADVSNVYVPTTLHVSSGYTQAASGKTEISEEFNTLGLTKDRISSFNLNVYYDDTDSRWYSDESIDSIKANHIKAINDTKVSTKYGAFDNNSVMDIIGNISLSGDLNFSNIEKEESKEYSDRSITNKGKKITFNASTFDVITSNNNGPDTTNNLIYDINHLLTLKPEKIDLLPTIGGNNTIIFRSNKKDNTSFEDPTYTKETDTNAHSVLDIYEIYNYLSTVNTLSVTNDATIENLKVNTRTDLLTNIYLGVRATKDTNSNPASLDAILENLTIDNKKAIINLGNAGSINTTECTSNEASKLCVNTEGTNTLTVNTERVYESLHVDNKETTRDNNATLTVEGKTTLNHTLFLGTDGKITTNQNKTDKEGINKDNVINILSNNIYLDPYNDDTGINRFISIEEAVENKSTRDITINFTNKLGSEYKGSFKLYGDLNNSKNTPNRFLLRTHTEASDISTTNNYLATDEKATKFTNGSSLLIHAVDATHVDAFSVYLDRIDVRQSGNVYLGTESQITNLGASITNTLSKFYELTTPKILVDSKYKVSDNTEPENIKANASIILIDNQYNSKYTSGSQSKDQEATLNTNFGSYIKSNYIYGYGKVTSGKFHAEDVALFDENIQIEPNKKIWSTGGDLTIELSDKKVSAKPVDRFIRLNNGTGNIFDDLLEIKYPKLEVKIPTETDIIYGDKSSTAEKVPDDKNSLHIYQKYDVNKTSSASYITVYDLYANTVNMDNLTIKEITTKEFTQEGTTSGNVTTYNPFTVNASTVYIEAHKNSELANCLTIKGTDNSKLSITSTPSDSNIESNTIYARNVNKTKNALIHSENNLTVDNCTQTDTLRVIHKNSDATNGLEVLNSTSEFRNITIDNTCDNPGIDFLTSGKIDFNNRGIIKTTSDNLTSGSLRFKSPLVVFTNEDVNTEVADTSVSTGTIPSIVLNTKTTQSQLDIRHIDTINANAGIKTIDLDAAEAINIDSSLNLHIQGGSGDSLVKIDTQGSSGKETRSYLFTKDSRHDIVTSEHVVVNQSFEVRGEKGFEIYWDETTNSMVFGKGKQAYVL